MTRQTHSTSTRTGSDPGETSIEAVILVPVVVMLVLIALQAGVSLHGANAAEHIAARGATAGARHGTDPGMARVEMEIVAESLGARLAAEPTLHYTEAEVTATVTVVIPRSLPVFPERITRAAVVPRERYMSFLERGNQRE